MLNSNMPPAAQPSPSSFANPVPSMSHLPAHVNLYASNPAFATAANQNNTFQPAQGINYASTHMNSYAPFPYSGQAQGPPSMTNFNNPYTMSFQPAAPQPGSGFTLSAMPTATQPTPATYMMQQASGQQQHYPSIPGAQRFMPTQQYAQLPMATPTYDPNMMHFQQQQQHFQQQMQLQQQQQQQQVFQQQQAQLQVSPLSSPPLMSTSFSSSTVAGVVPIMQPANESILKATQVPMSQPAVVAVNKKKASPTGVHVNSALVATSIPPPVVATLVSLPSSKSETTQMNEDAEEVEEEPEVAEEEEEGEEEADEEAAEEEDDEEEFADPEDEEYSSNDDTKHVRKHKHKSTADQRARARQASDSQSVPADQQSVIVCGVLNSKGERIFMEDSAYFGDSVDVYTAAEDPIQRTLYRASALAHKFHVATNQVGMYLVRRRHQQYVSGLYQATAFQCKPPGRTGLKAGGYFVSLDVCKEFEVYMELHAKHSRHIAKASRREKLMAESKAAAAAAAASAASASKKEVRKEASPSQSPISSSKLSKNAEQSKRTAALDALVQSAASPPASIQTSSVKVQSSESTQSASSMLYEFATSGLQSAASMQSSTPSLASSTVSASVSSDRKKRKMDNDSSMMSVASSDRRTPEGSPRVQMVRNTDKFGLHTAPTTFRTIQPTVEVFQRSDASMAERQRSTSNPTSPLGEEDSHFYMTDASSASHSSSAASSITSSQAGTPIIPNARLKSIAQATPKVVFTAPRTTSPVSATPVLPSYAVGSPNSAAGPPLPSCPSSPLSLHSVSSSPQPVEPVSPSFTKQRVMPVTNVVKFLGRSERSASNPEQPNAASKRDVQDLLRNLVDSNEHPDSPPAKRRTTEANSPSLASPTIIPDGVAAVPHMDISEMQDVQK